MSARAAARSSLALAALGLGLLAAPSRAGAATLEAQGWWSQLSPSAVLPELGGRPDAQEGQLVVEGTPSDAVSITAVRFRLEEGEANPVLTLAVADQVGTPETTVVLACAPSLAWQPAEGGAWENRPFPDCTTTVEGSPTPDGTAWTFAVGALADGDVVDVVLVPGKLPNGPDPVLGATFRLVFESPALTTTAAVAPVDPAPAAAPPTSSPSVAAPATSGSGGFRGPGAPVVPPIGTAVAPPPAGPLATPTTFAAAPPTAPASSSPDERPRWLGALLLAAALALAVASARSPRLGSTGGGDDIGGLGRFARPRTGPAPRLL